MIPKIHCAECDSQLSPDDKFCSRCGAKVEWRTGGSEVSPPSGQSERSPGLQGPLPAGNPRCPLCGHENSPDSSFCEKCGAALGETGPTAPSGRHEERRGAESDVSAKKEPGRKKEKPSRGKVGVPPVQSWKYIAIPVAVVVVGLIVYGLNNRGTDVRRDDVSAASTSTLEEIQQLEKALEANPEDSRSLLLLANRLHDARFLPRAIELYKRFLALDPKDPNARVDLGICYFESGDTKTAIVEMEQALKYEPLHQLGHLNLGIVNLNAGNLQKANEWFSKCVEINPNTEAGKRAQRMLEQHEAIREPSLP